MAQRMFEKGELVWTNSSKRRSQLELIAHSMVALLFFAAGGFLYFIEPMAVSFALPGVIIMYTVWWNLSLLLRSPATLEIFENGIIVHWLAKTTSSNFFMFVEPIRNPLPHHNKRFIPWEAVKKLYFDQGVMNTAGSFTPVLVKITFGKEFNVDVWDFWLNASGFKMPTAARNKRTITGIIECIPPSVEVEVKGINIDPRTQAPKQLEDG